MASYFMGDRAKKHAFCPFHDDKRNKSFSVFQDQAPPRPYKWYWKCWAGCGEGDEITFLEKLFGIDNATATRKFIELARDWNKRADRIVRNEIAANDWPTAGDGILIGIEFVPRQKAT
jgi:DNA primase